MRNVNVNEPQNQQSCQTSVSGCTGHFLTESVNALVYKTPQRIIDYVEKNKHDFLIQNPPYNDNRLK